jgi:hypothetical protein
VEVLTEVMMKIEVVAEALTTLSHQATELPTR